jgi:hypothetical protein
MKKIVFDLDGVIRDLGIIHKRFNIPKMNEWCWKYKDKDIYDWVKTDYSVLEEAKPTKYLKVIQDYINSNNKIIEIWSYQPNDWVKYTKNWINKYFKNSITYWLKPEEKYKKLLKEKDTILIEDYPKYPCYDKIILIDTYNNRNVKSDCRIKTVKELKRKLYGIQ